MASERQITANRRNARKSTGPRTAAGKTRSSRNAYRHGLSVSIGASDALAPELENLARKIAGDDVDTITLERAREIAQAELDLALVRRAKVAVMERAGGFATADLLQVSHEPCGEGPKRKGRAGHPQHAQTLSAAETALMPPRSAEPIGRVLSDLRKLNRYERRAAARRDRAVLGLASK